LGLIAEAIVDLAAAVREHREEHES
jgi:hypothetical protein